MPAAPAAPAEKPIGENQARIQADYIQRDGPADTLFARGHLFLRWRKQTVTADRALFDFGSDLVHIDGPVRLSRDDGTTVDTDSLDAALGKYWTVTGPFQATFPAAVVGYGATEAFYLWGSDARTYRDHLFVAHNATFSSCQPNNLLYGIAAKTIAVVPDKKIIFRSATVSLFGLPIMAFSKLVLPLRRYRRTEFLPEFGRNDVYGIYARMRYFYDAADSEYGDFVTTATEKRGEYLGLEHTFGLGRGSFRGDGTANLEYGTRFGEITARTDLNQHLGAGSTLKVNGSYSQNSGFSSTTSQTDITSLFEHQWGIGSTSLGYSVSGTKSDFTTSSFTRLTFAQKLNPSELFGADFGAEYSGRRATNTTSDNRIDTHAKFNGRWSLFDWDLTDERHFDVGNFAVNNNRAVTEIVPQVTLHTDSQRLKVPLPDIVNLRLDTSLGEFRDLVTTPGSSTSNTSTVMRFNTDLNGQLARVNLGRRLRFMADGRYSQSFYDHPGPAAKYIVALGPGFEYRPLRNTRVDVHYRWQEVHGYSPLQRFDFAQTLSDYDYTLSWFVPDPARPRNGLMAIRLNGGYDMLHGVFRDLNLQATVQPIDELSMTFNTSYAIEGLAANQGFRSLRGQLVYDGGRRWRQELGFTYDAPSGKMQTVDSLLTVVPLRHLTLQNALTWDGTRKRVSYNDLLMTYSLGCVSLVGSYRQQVKEYRLDINITALPGLTSLFGSGKFGQPFSTAQGVQF